MCARTWVVLLLLGLVACGDDVSLSDAGEDAGPMDGPPIYPDACFLGHTPIAAQDRSISIAELDVGDLVWSLDVTTTRSVLRPIARVHRRSATELYAIHTAAGVIDGVTGSHPLWVVDEDRYVETARLRVGQRLLGADGKGVEIEEIRRWKTASPVPVFTLTVAGPEHNYFAAGILAKNKTPIDTGIHDTGTPPGVICPEGPASGSVCERWCQVASCCLIDETETMLSNRLSAPASCELFAGAGAACLSACEARLEPSLADCLECLINDHRDDCSSSPACNSSCAAFGDESELAARAMQAHYTCWAGSDARPNDQCLDGVLTEDIIATWSPEPIGELEIDELGTVAAVDPIQITLGGSTLALELMGLARPPELDVGASVRVQATIREPAGLHQRRLTVSTVDGSLLVAHWAMSAPPQQLGPELYVGSESSACESSPEGCAHLLPLEVVVESGTTTVRLGSKESAVVGELRVGNERSFLPFNPVMCPPDTDFRPYEGWALRR